MGRGNRFGAASVVVVLLLVLGACGVDPLDSAGRGEQSVGDQSVGEQSVGDQSVGEQSVGERSVGERSVGERSVGERSVGERSVGDQSVGERSVGEQHQAQFELDLEPTDCINTVFSQAELCWVAEVVEERPDLSGDRLYLDIGVSGSGDLPSVVLLADAFTDTDVFSVGSRLIRVGVRGTNSSPLELRCNNGTDTCDLALAATGVNLDEYSLARRAGETSRLLDALAGEIGFGSFGLVAVGASVPLGQLIAADPPEGLDQVVLVPDSGFGANGRHETQGQLVNAWAEFVQSCVAGSRCVSELAVDETVETLAQKAAELYDVTLSVDDTIRTLLLSGAGSLAAIAASSSDPASVAGWLIGGLAQPSLLSSCDQDVLNSPCPDRTRIGPPATNTTLVRSTGGLRVGDLAGVSIVDVPALGANALDAFCGGLVVQAVLAGTEVLDDCLAASPWARYDSLTAGVVLEQTTMELYSGLGLALSTPKFWSAGGGFLSRGLHDLDSTWVTFSDVARDGLSDAELFDLAVEQTYLVDEYGLFEGQELRIDDGQEWTLLQDGDDYFRVTLAVRLYDDLAIVVQLETDPSEHDELVRDLLVPMLDSIELSGLIEQ